jgi:hypothetical protein
METEGKRSAATMSDMNDLQWTLVADRIADLGRERDAIRAEAVLDHLDQPRAGDALAAARPTRRARLGGWLMTIGERIAGPRRIAEPPARLETKRRSNDPCADGDRLAPAA